jgi:hypothetical protein
MPRRLTPTLLLLVSVLVARSCMPDNMCACPPAQPLGLDGVVMDGADARVAGVGISLWTELGDSVAGMETDAWGRFRFDEQAIFGVPLELRILLPTGYHLAEGQPHPVEVFIPVGGFEYLVVRVDVDP